jgi:hypothetical protein
MPNVSHSFAVDITDDLARSFAARMTQDGTEHFGKWKILSIPYVAGAMYHPSNSSGAPVRSACHT